MFHGYGFFGKAAEEALEKDRRRDGAEPSSRRPPKGHGLFWPELLTIPLFGAFLIDGWWPMAWWKAGVLLAGIFLSLSSGIFRQLWHYGHDGPFESDYARHWAAQRLAVRAIQLLLLLALAVSFVSSRNASL